MSYGGSAALQEAVYGVLSADAALASLVDGSIYEQPPAGDVPRLWVTLGGEAVENRSTSDGPGARHDLTVTVIAEGAGFARAKAAAGAICDALDGAKPVLSRGQVTAIDFLRARAVRDGKTRRIDLTFRVFLDDL